MKRLFIIGILLCLGGLVHAQAVTFSASATVGCVPFIVDFTCTSPNVTYQEWNFNDGTTNITLFDPSHTFYNAGTFSVNLKVRFADGTEKDTTYLNLIHVSAGPKISFTAAPDSVCPGELVNFVETISTPLSSVKSILWDFKDGGMSTQSKPIHAYANSGTYRPVLRVTDTLGCTSVDSVSKIIYVKPKPNANFTSGDSIFCVQTAGSTKQVTFTSTSTGNIASLKWEFDNLGTSTSNNPTQSFPIGDYDVSLIAIGTNGCTDTMKKSSYVSINIFHAEFSVTDTVVCSVPGKTTFTGTGGTRYNWKIYDEAGNRVNESIGSVYTAEFKSTGKYTVCMSTTSQLGCTDTTCIQDFIWVFDKMEGAIEVRDTDHCNPGAPIQFINRTQFDPENDLGKGSTVWNFGDNANQQGDSVTHVYGGYGHWVATAYITTPYGCLLDPIKQQIDIYHISTAGTMLNPAPPNPPGGCVPHEVAVGSIDDSLITSSPIVDYTWYWGDGTDSTSTEEVNMAEHTYKDTGIFSVYVEITNEQGCKYKILIQHIPVGMPPLNVWKFSDPGTKCINDFFIQVEALDSMCPDTIWRGGQIVKIDSVPCAGCYANSWSWLDPMGSPIGSGKQTTLSGKSFGSVGPVAWSLSPSHNQCGGKGPDTSNIGYICPPAAKIQYPAPNPMTQEDPTYCDYPTIPCADGTKGSCGWLWHFGNDTVSTSGVWWEGDTSTQQNPVYEYKPGSYINRVYSPASRWFDKTAQSGDVFIRLWVYNNDTDSTSENFNPCGYCEDSASQHIMISHADMKLVATNLDSTTMNELCQKDEVLLWDSTNCTTGLSMWGVHILDSIRNTVVPLQGNCPYFTNRVDSSEYKDGRIVTTRHPYRHKFDEYGVYYIILVDTDFRGCGTGAVFEGLANTKYVLDTLTWPQPPILEARMDTLRLVINPRSIPNITVPARGCANDSIQFLDASYTDEPFEDYEIIKYLWNSGGRTDTAKDPMFIYNAGGTFDVSLKVTNEKNCDSTKVFQKKINIYAVNAAWTLSNHSNEACNKDQIAFKSNVTTYPNSTTLSYEWDFNGGKKLFHTKRKATGKNAVASFDVDSTMFVTITLTVTDTVSGCRSVYVDSILIRKPIAEFTSPDHIAACPELQSPFVDLSYVSSSFGNTEIEKWEWFFEDKQDTAYSTFQNPTHIYTYAGKYDVTLVVTDDYGCTDTNFKAKYVVIDGPYGEFTMDTLSGCAPFSVQFKFSVTNADTLKLYPGDGNVRIISNQTAMKMPLRHTYQQAGRFIPVIQLVKWVTYTDSTGKTQKIKCTRAFVSEDTVWVIDLNPWFEIKDLYCQGVPITFKNLTDTINDNLKPHDLVSIDSLYWSFGNNTFDSINFDGVTQYDSAGTYNVNLWAKAKTCYKSTTRQIKVMEWPDIYFTHGDTSACVELDVEFTANNLNGEETQFDWTFSDGVTIQGNPVKRHFVTTDTYPYEVLITFSPDNCSKPYYDTVMINAWIPPVAEFSVADDDGVDLTDAVNGIAARADAHFKDLSTTTPNNGQIYHWLWEFGDEQKDSVVNPKTVGDITHAYTTTSGYVDVTLTITDEYGCKDTVTHQVLILESLKFPNVFSPNGDGINDVFAPTEDGGYFMFLEMIIYNRWGERVWRRACEDVQGGNKECPNYDDPDFWWNGKTQIGADASDGVYYWVLKARPMSESGDIILNGSVTLVR